MDARWRASFLRTANSQCSRKWASAALLQERLWQNRCRSARALARLSSLITPTTLLAKQNVFSRRSGDVEVDARCRTCDQTTGPTAQQKNELASTSGTDRRTEMNQRGDDKIDARWRACLLTTTNDPATNNDMIFVNSEND